VPSKLRNFAKKTTAALVHRLPRIPQRFQGKLLWVHPRARFSVSAKTFFKGESHVQRWLSDQLKRGDVFFDVGAHHGWVSMWALSLVGDNGVVYSFEPSPVNVPILEWHRKVNHFAQWTVVAKAVSNEDAEARPFSLIDAGDSPMNSLTNGVPGMPLMDGRDIRNVSIQTVTLDRFCAEVGARPNLVKIDVEGAELMVLRGAGKLLGQVRPALILAVHPFWLPAGQSTAQIVGLLKGYGYTLFDSNGKAVASLQSGEYLCLPAKSS
jgi:FkbM family methyltransferase